MMLISLIYVTEKRKKYNRDYYVRKKEKNKIGKFALFFENNWLHFCKLSFHITNLYIQMTYI